MTEEDVLIQTIELFDGLKIPYALTGGLAVSFYGHPRSTHDFDLILQFPPDKKTTKQLLTLFDKDFYISEAGIIDAVLHKTMFNIIHHETGLKIDLWIMKDSEYDREAFGRRIRQPALGIDVWILSAEDMIINKLLWYKISDLQKHYNDAKGIYEVQGTKIDRKYLIKWAAQLSIFDILKEIIK